MIAILTGMRWYFIVVLICLPLITNDVEHLFMYLLAFHVFSLEKYVFRPFNHFFKLRFCSCCCCMSSLYVLDVNPLSDIWFINIFYHSTDCLFTLLVVSFLCRSFLVWCSLVYFLFCFLYFRCHIQNIITKTHVEELCSFVFS